MRKLIEHGIEFAPVLLLRFVILSSICNCICISADTYIQRDVPKNSKMCAHISNIHSHAICQEKMFFAFNFISYSFGDEKMGRSLLVMGRVIKSRVLGFRVFAFLLIFQREKLATDNHPLPLLPHLA